MNNQSDFSVSTQNTLARHRAPLVFLAVLGCLAGAAMSRADSISFSVVDGLINGGGGTVGDFSATHSISLLGSDTVCLRNGSDSCSFSYRLIGQASADSTILSAADTASLSGSATFNFNLLDTAFWDIQADVSYAGAVGVNDAGPASAGVLSVTSSGRAMDIAFNLSGASQPVISSADQRFFSSSSLETVSNVSPGSGSVSVSLNLSCASGGASGGECLSSIGSFSTLSSFDLNNTLNMLNTFSDDGVTITVTLKPHLNFSGQTLNSNLILTGGEVLRGYGTVNGGVSGTGGTIYASGSGLILGNAADVNGFNFGGMLDVGNSSVILKDANFADLGASTTLSGGTLTATNGINLGSSSTLLGYGTVNGGVSGTGGTIRASGGSLILGNPADVNGFNFGGTLNVYGSVILKDANFADLGTSTTLSGGTLTAANGINLGSSSTLSGYGTVSAKVSGAADSRITASGSGLILGNAADPAGFSFGGSLNVGGSMVSLLSDSTADLGMQTILAGGVLKAVNGMSIDGSDTISGYGVIIGNVSGSNASAGLLIANPTGDVVLTGSLDIGNNPAAIYSQNSADLRSGTILSGGTLTAANGINLGSSSTLSGYGTVSAKVSGAAGSTITASGSGLILGNAADPAGFSFGGTLNVGSSTVALQDSNLADLGISTVLQNGKLIAANGLALDGTDTITGYGIIVGLLTGTNLASQLLPTGTLAFSSPLVIGSDSTTLLTPGRVNLFSGTTIAGGTLRATAPIDIPEGATFSGHGAVIGYVYGRTGSTITANGGALVLGDSGSFDGFRTQGAIAVGSQTVTLNARGFATLGTQTTLAGGTLVAQNGIFLGGGNAISGYGRIDARIAAATGSTIVAMDNLSLGVASALDGYFSDGVLDAANHVVTIYDRNQAVLGSLTSLAGGRLDAPNGLLLNPGRNLAGFGLVTANLRNDGSVLGQGPQPTDGLELSGYVNGTGDFAGNVTFSGSYSPGHSPASVHLENFSLASSSRLFIEIGGLVSGSAYDQLNASGTATLGGTLNVSLIDLGSGLFAPHAGDSFDILAADLLQGGFDTLGFSALLDPNLKWNISYLTDVIGTTDVVRLSVQAVPIPPAVWLFGSGILGLCAIARRKRK